MNLTYSGTPVTNYCSASTITCGVASFAGTGTGQWTPNLNFLHLRVASTGQLLTNNNAPAPFEAQFTVRFLF